MVATLVPTIPEIKPEASPEAVVSHQFAGNLVANWSFDDGSGQLATDSSGNGIDAQLGATSGADSSDPTWSSTGVNTSLEFDGVDDHLIVPSDASLDNLFPGTMNAFYYQNGQPKYP